MRDARTVENVFLYYGTQLTYRLFAAIKEKTGQKCYKGNKYLL